MAESIKTKFPGIGSKNEGSEGTSTEWNGIVNELVEINASEFIDLGKETSPGGSATIVEANILIGYRANEEEIPESAAFNNNGRVTIGTKSRASDWRQTTVGAFCTNLSLSATAYGFGTTIEKGNVHSVAIGRGAHIPPNTGAYMVLGTRGCNHLYIGNGIFHRADVPSSTVSIGDQEVPSDITQRYHGQDAWDSKEIPDDFNVDAGHVGLSGGRGTGTGIGGNVKLETAPVGSVGENAKNILVSAAEFDASSGNDTRFLLLDTTDGTLKRVSFGADDSAGAGFKVLRVEN